MAKIQNLSELSQSFSFTEYDFFDFYRRSFEHTELGRMKKHLPLREMAESFGLVSNRRAPKRGRKPYFTPEGKVALMFLKIYTQMSSPKLMKQLDGDGQPRLLQGERHPDLLCQTRPPIADRQRERLCKTGTCEGESHNNGRVVRDAEGALLNAEDQGEEEGDGDPVHLLRNPHCQCSPSGGEVAGGADGGGGLTRLFEGPGKETS